MRLYAQMLWATLILFAFGPQAQTVARPPASIIVDPAMASPGDSPADPGPLATDISPALHRKAIRRAMKKVVDWQLAYAGLTGNKTPRYDREWTYAALYDGLLAYSQDTGDRNAHDAVLLAATKFGWQMRDASFPNADDEALGHAYLDLYREQPEAERIASTKAVMDRLVARADEPKPLWWWCDALYMAPPTLVRLAKITGNRKYIDTMNHEWWDVTTALLYNSDEHLYFRDDRFLDLAKQHEANGKPIFWSRGNGWVMAGLVNILRFLPPNDPARPRYVQLFQQMLTRIAALQPADAYGAPVCLTPAPTRCRRSPVQPSSRMPWPTASTRACWTAPRSSLWFANPGRPWLAISMRTDASATFSRSASRRIRSNLPPAMSMAWARSCSRAPSSTG